MLLPTPRDEADVSGKEGVPVEPSAEVIVSALDNYETKQRLSWHFSLRGRGRMVLG